VSELLPRVSEAAPLPAPAPPEGTLPDEAARGTQPPRAARAPSAGPTAREWLAARSESELTLQIFAVNSLDRVQQLLTSYPHLQVHIVATEGSSPRFRVLHGVYASEAAARAAFQALPADLSQAAGGAIVKSFAAVREDLAASAPAPDPAATHPAAPAAAGDYTVQLFASGNRDNARALVDAFPALSLELIRRDGDPAPYRVVYGRYRSPEEARRAASGLPQSLLGRVGKPLVKTAPGAGLPVR
jgi:septal ring-binding cell division protein DamX